MANAELNALFGEFGLPMTWQDRAYHEKKNCGRRVSGGGKTCPVTGQPCKQVNKCDAVIYDKSFAKLHGDASAGAFRTEEE